MKTETTERSVLITNLLDVSIDTAFGKVRTRTNALVLSDRGSEGNGPRYRAYGFHNEAGNLLFDTVLPSFDWTIEPQSYRRAFVLRIAGTPEARFELLADFANDEPLDIEHWDESRGSWADTLVRKVLRYYHAPYFILGQQFEADNARQVLGIERVKRSS